MKKIFTLLLTLAFVSISLVSITYTSGPGGGLTNAPGEGNCTSCHSGTLNGGGALSNFKLDGDFTGGGYIPDSTYTMTLEMTQSGRSKFGFNITALTANTNDPTDNFSISSSSTTQLRTKTVSGKTRTYVEHTSGGTSATKTNGIEWEFKWKAPSSNVGDIKFYATCNASNSNGGSSGDFIYAKAFTVEPSSLLPTVKGEASDTVVCSSAAVSFKANTSSKPTAYSWIFPNGSPSVSTDSTPTVTYSFQGKQKAMVRVKNTYGWSQYDTVELQVLQSPTAFIQGGANRKICKGGSLELVANFNPTYKYTWITGATGNKLTVTDTGSYIVKVKSGTCERVSNTVHVTYFDDTITSLTASNTKDSICKGEMVRLTAGSGYDSFYWYKNEQLILAGDTNILDVAVDSNWMYFVRVKDNNGCIGSPSDSIQYTHIPRTPKPEVTCENKTPFSVDYYWNDNQAHGGVQVSTNKGATWIEPSSGKTGKFHRLSGLVPEKDYELWVRGVTESPCFYTEVTKQICRSGSCSPLEATVVADSQICEGEELRVEVNGLSNERYSMSFEGGQPFTDTIFTFSPLVDKTYIIEITDSNAIGCPPKELSFPVYIDEIEQLNFRTQKPSNFFCQDDTIEFRASPGNDQYTFFVNNALRSSTTDSFYFESQFNDGDSAFVAVKKGVCEDTSETIYLNLVPEPISSFTYDSMGSVYTFTPDVKAHREYFWDFGDGFTSVLMEPQHDYQSSSNQSVKVSLDVEDNSGCLSSSEITLNLPDFSSVLNLGKDQIRIYPSPVQTELTVDLGKATTQNLIIRLIDLRGVVLFEATPHGETALHFDLSSLASGIYSVEIQGAEDVVRYKVLKN